MRPVFQPDEEALDELDPQFEEPVARPQTNYRVAGDLEVRSKELEQALAQTKAKMHAMERELWAARKTVRNRKGLRAASIGGLGALVGSILGMIAYSVQGAPWFVVAGAVVGFVVAALGSMRWDPRDDDFPSAPPPRGLIG